jgi:hypothetical protein
VVSGEVSFRKDHLSQARCRGAKDLPTGGRYVAFYCPWTLFEETGYLNIRECDHPVLPRGELLHLGRHRD